MPVRHRQLVAALFALLYLWMGTGGVLHHTDAPQNGASASTRVAWTRPAALLPADLCAACEWTAHVAAPLTVTASLALPFDYTGPAPSLFSPPLLTRPSLSLPARAPPTLS